MSILQQKSTRFTPLGPGRCLSVTAGCLYNCWFSVSLWEPTVFVGFTNSPSAGGPTEMKETPDHLFILNYCRAISLSFIFTAPLTQKYYSKMPCIVFRTLLDIMFLQLCLLYKSILFIQNIILKIHYDSLNLPVHNFTHHPHISLTSNINQFFKTLLNMFEFKTILNL